MPLLLSTVQVAYRPPAVSIAPTTKSLVVPMELLVGRLPSGAIAFVVQVAPWSHEMFTMVPPAVVPMNSYSVPVLVLMITGPGRAPSLVPVPTQRLQAENQVCPPSVERSALSLPGGVSPLSY